jgi:hypothetical protein
MSDPTVAPVRELTTRPNQTLHQQIRRDRAGYRLNPDIIQTFRNYARGEQKLVLTEKQKEILQGLLGQQVR